MSNQVDEVEVVAAAWALECSLEVGINQCILQGDSKVVMKISCRWGAIIGFLCTFINGLFGLRGSVYIYIYIYIDILAFGLFFLLFYMAKHSC